MSADAYSLAVIEHFQRPRNIGAMSEDADVVTAAAGDVRQGVHFALSARISQDRIAEMRFQAYGCPHCIAAGSWLTERLRGAALADLDEWSWREAAQALDIPAEKRGRLLILEDAVRTLARSWRQCAGETAGATRRQA